MKVAVACYTTLQMGSCALTTLYLLKLKLNFASEQAERKEEEEKTSQRILSFTP